MIFLKCFHLICLDLWVNKKININTVSLWVNEKHSKMIYTYTTEKSFCKMDMYLENISDIRKLVRIVAL